MKRPINQRIKFLLEALQLSARDFSRALGVADNNTQNYLEPRFAQPKADYLEKIMLHFGSINSSWLLTGNGEPFLPSPDENNQAIVGNQKFFRSPVVATGQGPAYQENNATLASDVEAIKNKLALAEQEVEHLKAQLSSRDATIAAKDMIIAAKDDMLALLRITYNRPN